MIFNTFSSASPDPSDNYKPLIINEAPKTSEIIRISSGMVDIPGGIFEVGYNGNSFCYDNEVPEHKVYLQPFKMDMAPVTNGEYMKFIEDGGYEDYRYWLADGWELAKERAMERTAILGARGECLEKEGFTRLEQDSTQMSPSSMSVTMKQMHMRAGQVRGFQPRQSGKKRQAGTRHCREKRCIHGEIKGQLPNIPTSLNPTYGAHPR